MPTSKGKKQYNIKNEANKMEKQHTEVTSKHFITSLKHSDLLKEISRPNL